MSDKVINILTWTLVAAIAFAGMVFTIAFLLSLSTTC